MSKSYIRATPNYVNDFSFKKEQILTLNQFAGGMNNVEPDNVIDDNQSPDCKNMMFIANSLMEKRYGTKYVDQAAYPDLAEPITWVDEYRPTNGVNQLVRGTDTGLWIGNTKICTVLGRVKGANYIDKYYFVDGKYLYVYDGVTYYQVCDVHSYTTAATAANNATFVLKAIPNQVKVGDPFYFILADNTKASLVISTIDRTTNTIVVTTAHTAIVPKETIIYFYVPLVTGTYLEGTEVWDETTHYAYYQPCADQLKVFYAGTPYIPDSPNIITVHKDRIFIAGDTDAPHNVYMSSIDSVSTIYFPAGAGIGVKPDGQKIIDLVVFDEALIIGRHSDMYVLYGNTEYQNISDSYNVPFNIKQMDVSIGFMSVDCGAMINNYYVYLGYDGRFYRLNTPTTYVEYLMTKPLDWKIDLYKEPFNLTVGTELDVSAITFYNEIYFNIGTNMTLVYNYDTMGWTYFVGFNEDCLFTDGINLYIGRHDGKLTVYDTSKTNYNDIAISIDSYYKTKRFDLGASAAYKYFTKFMVSSNAWEDLTSYIEFTVEIDNFYSKVDAYVISSNLSRFGVATWGESFFNDKDLVKSGWKMLDVRGRTIRFKFANNNNNEPFRIYDVNIGYSMRDVR